MFVLIFLVMALVGAGIHLALQKQPRTGQRIVEIFLLWVLVVCVGVNGLFAFYGHAFRADETARMIGWPTGNPFQFEVAIADLVFGILGILCIWIRGTFWYAAGLAGALFGLGAAYGHIVQMVVYGDYAPDNAGLFLYSEIAVALLTLGLLLAYKVLGQRAQTQQAASVPV
jgi:hypothetical protein